MSKAWHKGLHRLARALGWIAGIAVITLAVLVALTQLFLPMVAKHPQWVATQLSGRLHRPVSFAGMEGRWQGSGPSFVLHDLTIGPGEGGGKPLHIPEAELKLDFGGWLLPSRHLVNLRARGLQLDLSREIDGTWHINGLGVTGGQDRQSVSLGRLSVGLWLDDLRLDIDEKIGDRHYTVIADQVRVSRQHGRIRAGLLLHRDGTTGHLRGAADFREDGAQGRLWLHASHADLRDMLVGIDLGGYEVVGGQGSFSSWLDWDHGKVSRNLTRFDLDQLAVKTPESAQVDAPPLHGTAQLRHTPDGYDVRWLSDDGGALALAMHQMDTDQARVEASASQLQLAPLLPWLALKPHISASVAQWLGQGKPRGEVISAGLRFSRSEGLTYLYAKFDGMAIDAVGKLPGLDSLHGQFRGDAESMLLSLPAQAATVNFPHTFRKPLAMSNLAGDIAFWHEDDAFHIGTEQFDFVGEDFGGQARGQVALPDSGGRPVMDLYATVDHAKVSAAKLFWPIDSMPQTAIDWLDHALIDGRVDHGDVLIHGDLRDWPFRHNEGRFEARAQINDLVLDYGKNWPRADGIKAVAYFVNNGMQVEASAGQSLGNKVDKATAAIPDFGDTVLDLAVQGTGTGPSMIDFVRSSPIASHQADVLSKFSLTGGATFGFHMVLPIKDAKDFTLDGQAQLKDIDFNAPEWNIKLDKLTGPATFNAKGFHAGPLQTRFRDQPSTVDVAIADATGQPDKVFAARMTGRYQLSTLIKDYSQLHWLNDIASGQSDYTIGFDIASAAANGQSAQTLTIDSPLVGTALNLPLPVRKEASADLPLHLALGLPVNGGDLQMSLGSVARGRFRLPDGEAKPLAASIMFGNRTPDALPDKGMRIRGQAGKLDVSGWVQSTIGGNGPGGPGLESIDISTDEAQIFGRTFARMHIKAAVQPNALSIDTDSVGLAGHFDVPTDDVRKRGITARMQRLYWPKDNTPAASRDITGAPASSATVPGNDAQPPAHPEVTGIDPKALPPFHLWIGDLRFGDAKLGEARFESWPTERGMHIDQIRTQSHSVQINATGAWNGTPDNSHTHLRIDFAAQSLGDMLAAFGYGNLVAGGKTNAQLDATWPGSPSGMDLANMDGRLSVNVANGRIPEVAPGVGRLFGLVSVLELPRRLTLDFGDVFGKGLGFDAITGDFTLGNGNAVTNNMKILGPAAAISITGRTGLRTRDYDQQVHVVPHVGNSLPVVGAVLGGPIGVAAGVVAQGLLGHGLNHAAAKRYHISGSWDKPDITPIDKADPKLPPPPANAPAPAGDSSAD
ncbi:YhdP family protein [Dyella sp.]|uniref:YhdP family protein n=1 Tax=Dyella sp. TaxID=1869338 RepID=UPI002ED5DB24